MTSLDDIRSALLSAVIDGRDSAPILDVWVHALHVVAWAEGEA